MKSFITALIIAVLLCIASFYYSFKIKGVSDMLLSDTERISTALDDDNFSGAADMTRRLDRSVKQLEPFLSAFGNHEDVTLVEGCLAQLEVYAEGMDKTEALASSKYLANMFEHMPQNLYIRLENVL